MNTSELLKDLDDKVELLKEAVDQMILANGHVPPPRPAARRATPPPTPRPGC